MSETQTKKQLISFKAFTHGLIAVAVLYTVLGISIALQSSETLKNLESRLDSKTVAISQRFRASHPDIISPEVEQEMQQEAGEHALPTNPIEDLFERTPEGPLPKVAANGLTCFQAYKRPFVKTGAPLIVIAIKDFGLSEDYSQSILDTLPPEVSLILSPYSSDPNGWQKKARAKGHEVWLGVPTETQGYPDTDPGPLAILSRSSLQHNLDVLKNIMMQTTNYAGIAAFTDSSFNDAMPVIKKLLGFAYERGLGFFETNPNGLPELEAMAASEGYPYIQNMDYPLESDSDLMTGKSDIESRASMSGYSVVLVESNPEQIRLQAKWIETLKNKGFALAPLSAVAGAQKTNNHNE